jgi:hypothetical protein
LKIILLTSVLLSQNSKCNNKGKLAPLLPLLIVKAQCHEDVYGNGGTTPPFLTSAVDGSEHPPPHLGSIIHREIAFPVPIG